MSRKRKPYDPAAATLANLERRERDQELARLRAQGAEVTTDRGGKIISARRSNVFTLLLSRGTITPNQHDAAYRLAQDWATWKGLDGGPEPGAGKVDGSSGSRELVTDRMIQAGRRIFGTMEQIGWPIERLLVAFMVATVEEDRPMQWRGIVERVTREARRDHQTAAVVEALEALRQVYEQPAERRAA
jgi:hypothetical protein